MKLLITGGAGFIGSALIRYLIEHTNAAVVNVDKLTYAGHLESLAAISANPRYCFVQLDVCDREALDRVLTEHQPDAVMHLAAESHVDRSIHDPAECIQTNIIGTYTLLEATRAYWNTLAAPRKTAFRFHHISTDEVYGDLPHPSDVNAPQPLPRFTEHTAYAPSSPYSASKASADHLVRAWHRTYGLPILISHCSNNYGPYQFPEKLIPLVISNALQGKTLPLYGAGDQIRDWLYVEDHARALYTVITQGEVGQSYNIGGDSEKSNIEVVTVLCEILDELMPPHQRSNRHAGQPFRQQARSYTSLITHVTDRPGHDRRYAIDARKINTTLNWQPRETFTSGLRKTVQWYLAHPQWCTHVQSMSQQRLGAST